MTASAHPVPGYCHGLLHTITPAQWEQCWKLGWGQPSATAGNAGYYFGHNVMPVLAVAVLVVLVLALFRGRRGRPAPDARLTRRERAGARR